MHHGFANSLRYLAEGTRLYGRDQPGQALVILAVSIYLPLVLPLLRHGIWIEFQAWVEAVVVPTPGLMLAGYAVVVAIVIALALTPSSASALAPVAPYPIERPVKSRIIHNCRLFLIALIGLSLVGVVFSSGVERLEHLLSIAIGALLLQLGHLDEVNAVEVESVLNLLGERPLQSYDEWFLRRWGRARTSGPVMSHRRMSRWRWGLILGILLTHLILLCGYIFLVHGAAGLPSHGLSIIFLPTVIGCLSVLSVDALQYAALGVRHARGSRYDSWLGHSETYFAAVVVGARLLATGVMISLPLLWMHLSARALSLAYLGFAVADLLVFLVMLVLLVRRWLAVEGRPIRPVAAYDEHLMAIMLKKRAARDRAAIRGALAYRERLSVKEQPR